ncbi:MAG: class I SAM-dependent methyltransferase [Bacteroidota bacterium]
MLPEPLREALSTVNQRLFARRTIRRKYGDWFDVDWRQKFQSLSDEEWKLAYDTAWKHHRNECVESTDEELILGSLGERGSVLEVGCGAGSLAIRLAKEGYSVTGLDVSTEALRQASAHAARDGVSIDWRQGFIEHLPLADKSYDYVTCCHTLEHVKDLPQSIAELKRVARKRIVVLTPRQRFRLYAENYHTQFFETRETLIGAFALERYECSEIDCIDHLNEFQGKTFLYVGYFEPPIT